jgi:hypothetical protein
MEPILILLITAYFGIAANNLVVCCILMYGHTKHPGARKLGWIDVMWAIGLTLTGPVGSGAIIFGAIQILRER